MNLMGASRFGGAPPKPDQNGAGTRAAVLVVEDNPINFEVAKELLEAHGCNVTVAFNGLDAVAKIFRTSFDLVLMDLQMPVMDGLSATRRIRTEETESDRARVPIVAVTANAFAEDRARCIAAGMDDYLSKPYSEDDLVRMLGKWLPHGSRPIAAASVADKHNGQPTRSQNEPSSTAIDPSALANLKASRPDLLQRLITTFLAHAPVALDELAAAAKRGDLETLAVVAHSLKSSSANLGAYAMTAACRELERAAKAGSREESETWAGTVCAAFMPVDAALRNEASQLSNAGGAARASG